MIPIFIGGTGRSGTTILRKVLAHHPDVSSIHAELRIIVDPGGALDLYHALTDRWSPYAADAALHRFRDLLARCESGGKARRAIARGFHRVGISPPPYLALGLGDRVGRTFYRERTRSLLREISSFAERGVWIGSPPYQAPATILDTDWLPEAERSSTISRFFHDLFNHAALGRDVTHWIDDTPFNILHAEDLLRLFPGLRLVHVHRDFRDVLASYRHKGWGQGSPMKIARRIAAIIDRWLVIRSTLPRESYLEVALSDLVDGPGKEMERILRFCQLESSEELNLQLARFDRGSMNAGRWRQELSAAVQNEVVPTLTPALAAYGYA